jgi:hypothetical protein
MQEAYMGDGSPGRPGHKHKHLRKIAKRAGDIAQVVEHLPWVQTLILPKKIFYDIEFFLYGLYFGCHM